MSTESQTNSIEKKGLKQKSVAPDQPKKKPDIIALEIVKNNGAVPFLDAAGEPRLRRKLKNPEKLSLPIRSRQTGSWVARLYYDKTKELLDRRSLDRVLLCLEGLAEDNDCSDIELCYIIEIEPILGLLIRHVRHEQQVKINASSLLKVLNNLTKDSPHLRTTTWPQSPEALGRRIRRLLPWIQKAGISADFTRDKQNRWIILSDGTDSSPTKLTTNPSSHNDNGSNELRHHDNSDRPDQLNPEAQFNFIMNGELS